MGLIEGLDEVIAEEAQRLRDDLRVAIATSDYSVRQVASLADIGEKTLYNILNGAHAPQLDTLLRIAFILGVRIEFAGSEEAQSRPFRVIATAAQSESSSRRSTSSSSRSAGAKKKADRATPAVAKKKTRRQKGTGRGKTTEWWTQDPVYLRKHIPVTSKAA